MAEAEPDLAQENAQLRSQLAYIRIEQQYPGVDLDRVRQLAGDDLGKVDQIAQALYDAGALGRYRNQPNGNLPLPPSNLVAAGLSEDEEAFVRIQRMNLDNDQRRLIEPHDARRLQRQAFARMLNAHGNDPDFYAPSGIKDALRKATARDLSPSRVPLRRANR